MKWPFRSDAKMKTGVLAPSAPNAEFPAAYPADSDRPDVFDPALKHYPRAYVKGPPSPGVQICKITTELTEEQARWRRQEYKTTFWFKFFWPW